MEVTLPEFVNATEADSFEVCASVSSMQRERDVILIFNLMPDSMFASKLQDSRVVTLQHG